MLQDNGAPLCLMTEGPLKGFRLEDSNDFVTVFTLFNKLEAEAMSYTEITAVSTHEYQSATDLKNAVAEGQDIRKAFPGQDYILTKE